MSTTPQAPPPAIQPAVSAPPPPNSVTVISHSTLFYWWPVWAVGFIMAGITFLEGNFMAVVPPGTTPELNVSFEADNKTEKNREAYVFPLNKKITRIDEGKKDSLPLPLKVHVSKNKSLGVIYCIVLLLVIVITNVPLRGMWSVVVIITLILLSVIFALAGIWENIMNAFSVLDIRINMGGYIFISTALLAAWLFTTMFFDKQIYMVFTPGQFKVCTEIGGGEKVYDTIGLTLERQRSDLFRHLILGLGSGDLIVKTTGAQSHHFDLPNVLWINKKVQMIEDLLRQQRVVETR